MNYQDKKNLELSENQLNFLTAFTDGLPIHILSHWIKSNMNVYIQNNISNLDIEKIIAIKTNGIALEGFIPSNKKPENTFSEVFNKLYKFFILDQMKDKCLEGLQEFKLLSQNTEDKRSWLAKYEEYGMFVFMDFLVDGGYDNKGIEPFYHVTIDNERIVKILKSEVESQINFGELYFENHVEENYD